MSRNTIISTDTALVVKPRGLDKLWSFKRKVEVPWEHVRGATHDPGMKHEPKGWRGPGLRAGSKPAGTFHRGGEHQLWNVSGFENAVVIELVNEHFSRLIVSLSNPAMWAAKINERLAAHR
ncbi:hypothetical protein [Corynebacterium timonense]|uniref:Uncharacterized protein n=1 Tax=Corynebacterium timonense TaxID=441500 RepID=A0A1H1LI78_9CORY|nr:hypothetical protein [Corynebacterium timonense]SDR74030.1 hypothetical protein SAMN04488539_0218 [Corynebacterium timonense]